MPTFRQIALLPFTGLYRLGVALRNGLYRSGLYKSIEFEIPLIAIGNLSTGGTGKTPHVLYLLEQLKGDYKLATMSRGYGRKTSGFRLAEEEDTAESLGDEPILLKQAHPDVPVAVGEQRVLAIPDLLTQHPETQAILLDDAFQHRAVKAGLYILLTTYDHPYSKDWLLPSGDLREPRAAAKRADIVIVTKCSSEWRNGEVEEPARPDKGGWRRKLNLKNDQELYFTRYAYQPLRTAWDNQPVDEAPEDVLLVTGIANSSGLLEYVQSQTKGTVVHQKYRDHKRFTQRDVDRMCAQMDTFAVPRKALVTTAKDATRLAPFKSFFAKRGVPVLVQPIGVQFLEGEAEFLNQIKEYIES